MAEVKFSELPLAGSLVGDEVLVGLKPSGSESDEENVLITVEDLTQHVLNQDSGAGGGGASDAADLTYTADDPTNWDGDTNPGEANDALDQLAERVKDLEGGSGGVGLTLLESRTASASASLDFTTRNAVGQSGVTFQSDYDEYMVEFVNIVPATDTANLHFRVSTDGGSTFVSAAASYAYSVNWFNRFGSSQNGSDSTTQIDLTGDGIDNGSDSGMSGSIKIFDPLSSTRQKRLTGQMVFRQGAGGFSTAICNGHVLGATAVDAFRVLMSSGNIASGTIRVYGVAK